jgi:hypothetical protein
MAAADEVIKASIHSNRIEHVPYSARLQADLTCAASDSAESEDEFEFWGEDDNNAWRVHMDKPRAISGKPLCKVYLRDLTTQEVHELPSGAVFRLSVDGGSTFFGDSDDKELLTVGTECDVLCEKTGEWWPSVIVSEIDVLDWINVDCELNALIARGVLAITVAGEPRKVACSVGFRPWKHGSLEKYDSQFAKDEIEAWFEDANDWQEIEQERFKKLQNALQSNAFRLWKKAIVSFENPIVRVRDLLLSIDDPRADRVTIERVKAAVDMLDEIAFMVESKVEPLKKLFLLLEDEAKLMLSLESEEAKGKN